MDLGGILSLEGRMQLNFEVFGRIQLKPWPTIAKSPPFSKFIVYFSLLTFSVLLALKLDGILDANYLIVFAPLWTTNIIVLLGFLVGFVGFCMSPTARFAPNFSSLLFLSF